MRAIYRYAIRRDHVAFNPTLDIEMPQARGRRERIAQPAEANALLSALPPEDRALWATALFAGLRRGELRALRWSDVSMATSEIRVTRAWDDVEGELDPKSDAGKRTIPVLGVLRDYLDQHKLTTWRDGDDLVFGRTEALPFTASTIGNRAKAAWTKAGLTPITLHECRHTTATLLISGGGNAKALQTIMGHSSIAVTYDVYGHLFPGSRDEVRERMDAYLEAELAASEAS